MDKVISDHNNGKGRTEVTWYCDELTRLLSRNNICWFYAG